MHYESHDWDVLVHSTRENANVHVYNLYHGWRYELLHASDKNATGAYHVLQLWCGVGQKNCEGQTKQETRQ